MCLVIRLTVKQHKILDSRNSKKKVDAWKDTENTNFMCPALTNVTQESKGFICEFIVYASYSFGKHIPDPPRIDVGTPPNKTREDWNYKN